MSRATKPARCVALRAAALTPQVFALTALYLSQPPVRFQETLQNLHRQDLAHAYEFVVHASRYPKSAHQHSPASPVETWHVVVTRKGFRVGKGQVRGKYARRRLEKVVIECCTSLDLALCR